MHALESIKSTSYKKHIAWLREARVQCGLTQAQLAAELRKPQSFVAKVEICERRIDIYEYVRWTRAIGVEPATAILQLDAAMLGTDVLRKRMTHP